MWFKQIQIFPLTKRVQSSASAIAEQLEPLAFKPCLPSMPQSVGWVPPIDEAEMPLTRGLNGCIMICLQIEEKILPASVINQTLKEKIKQIEATEARRMRQKEKLSYKDEVIHQLLPRAFSKYTRIYAYIDTTHNRLVVNSISPAKTELFLSQFKKSLGECIDQYDVIKPGTLITHWLKSKDYPAAFSIEKACMLQDPNQQNRTVRCQQQDLFVSSIQSLLKEGYEVVQIALCWHDRINFVIADDFTLRSVRLADEDIVEIKEEIETKLQKFDADFILMTEMFAGWFNELLSTFQKQQEAVNRLALTG